MLVCSDLILFSSNVLNCQMYKCVCFGLCVWRGRLVGLYDVDAVVCFLKQCMPCHIILMTIIKITNRNIRTQCECLWPAGDGAAPTMHSIWDFVINLAKTISMLLLDKAIYISKGYINISMYRK